MTAGHSTDPTPPPRRRVFFALWPDEPVRQAIARSTRNAVRHCGGKPTPRENLHITLAFLGPVTAESLAAVMDLAAPPAAGFELTFDRLGLWDRSHVLWIAPSEVPPVLTALEQALWDRLVALGFARDPRPYRPHLTIARKAQSARGAIAPVTWQVDGFSLVESKTGPRNSRYIVLKSWEFPAEP